MSGERNPLVVAVGGGINKERSLWDSLYHRHGIIEWVARFVNRRGEWCVRGYINGLRGEFSDDHIIQRGLRRC